MANQADICANVALGIFGRTLDSHFVTMSLLFVDICIPEVHLTIKDKFFFVSKLNKQSTLYSQGWLGSETIV